MTMDNNETKSYVAIMIQSLNKKQRLLDKIIIKNNEQAELFKGDHHNNDLLETNVKEKSDLLDQLNLLDNGFEKLYNRTKEELDSNRARYAADIRQMQDLIKGITERGARIEAQEKHNHTLATNYFSISQQRIGKVRNTNKVAELYRQNMRGTSYIESHFWDKKK